MTPTELHSNEEYLGHMRSDYVVENAADVVVGSLDMGLAKVRDHNGTTIADILGTGEVQGNVPEKISFPEVEKEILDYWDKIDAFKKSLKQTEGLPEYTFYDGPPFATGMPHYGHLLAGTVKDTVTRYATMTGHHCSRRFGWDTHGLPVEFEIDKKFGLKGAADVIKMGIPQYNAECRKIVMKYSTEWKHVVRRIGRWIDMEHDYKTMDLSYMETVWWVFKQLFDKGLVYRGFKVLPFSTGCSTPLSNFEAKLDYREVSDPAVHILFPLADDPGTCFIGWTTTPWTLPSNLALCVNPEYDYVTFSDSATGKKYIMLESLLKSLPGGKGSKREIISKCKGKDLVGKKYIPLFDYFNDIKTAFRVISDGYVTNDSGTGVVHCAPAFGEDDYRVCVANGIVEKGDSLVCPVDESGKYTSKVKDYEGKYVKDCDNLILDDLKRRGRLFAKGSIVHSYPFCWRSGTPLLYKAVSSWFIEVEKIKDKIIANNKKSAWVPEFVQEKRFHNWLAEAHDWAVSRNRFWGTPIPIWTNEDYSEMVCVGSVKELEELTGKKITDLHRESIDDLTIPSKKGGKPLHRIFEVFDCWFESGSMPYAQLHYPFENKEVFERGFPADFVAEGIDQTRGWFYTLLVLGTALFDNTPYRHLIVHGLILAADGRKMSKSLRNYPDPLFVTDTYGADALRLYLINSPVVRGDNLRFQEKGVKELISQMFLPWYNAFRFFHQNVEVYEKKAGKPFVAIQDELLTKGNVMDKWILSLTQSLIIFVRKEMELYHLYTVVPRLVDFISLLTNWFVRLNRSRIKGNDGYEEAQVSLSALFHVLFDLCKLMAPFTPMFVEYVYQHIKKYAAPEENLESVHFLRMPEPWKDAISEKIENAVASMKTVIELGRVARERRKTPMKYPLSSMTVVETDQTVLDDLKSLESYIVLELNILELKLSTEEGKYIKVTLEPERAKLGKRLRNKASAVYKAIAALSPESVKEFTQKGKIEIEGCEIAADDVKVNRSFVGDTKRFEACWEGGIVAILDLKEDDELTQKGLARNFINRVQKARKKGGITPNDLIDVYYVCDPADSEFAKAIAAQTSYISRALNATPRPLAEKPADAVEIITEESAMKLTLEPNKEKIAELFKGKAADVEKAIASLSAKKIKKFTEDGKIDIEDKDVKEITIECVKVNREEILKICLTKRN